MKKPWLHILLALATEDRYGSAIQEEVRALSGGEVRLWPATLYGSFEELLEAGWIRQLDEHEQPGGAGGRERYYRITPSGRAALSAEARRFDAMAHTVRTRLGEESV